jgi:uncharacterized protein YndB with AHSA1/START domain
VKQGGVRVQRRYGATLDELWAALVEPESVSSWLGSVNKIEPHEGGAFDVEFTPDRKNTMYGRITAIEPPHFLELEWHFPGEPVSRVRLELHEEADGVRLVVDHRGLDQAAATAYGEGWKTHLAELESIVNEGGRT